jgi:hypothetical protein
MIGGEMSYKLIDVPAIGQRKAYGHGLLQRLTTAADTAQRHHGTKMLLRNNRFALAILKSIKIFKNICIPYRSAKCRANISVSPLDVYVNVNILWERAVDTNQARVRRHLHAGLQSAR